MIEVSAAAFAALALMSGLAIGFIIGRWLEE